MHNRNEGFAVLDEFSSLLENLVQCERVRSFHANLQSFGHHTHKLGNCFHSEQPGNTCRARPHEPPTPRRKAARNRLPGPSPRSSVGWVSVVCAACLNTFAVRAHVLAVASCARDFAPFEQSNQGYSSELE